MSIFSTAAKELKQVTEGVINEKGTGYIMPEPNTQEKFLTPKEAAELSKKSHGAVVIPVDKEEICDHAFDGDERLTSISVPSSVKRIRRRAFANCINLRTVELADGVETIESKIFTGCTGLTKLTIPDSVRKLCGGMFHNLTGLQTPVDNKSGTILYFYPCTAESIVFTIPNNVEQINPEAFSENPYLEEVVLPHELKTLAYQSFLRCGIRRITISKATKRIERRAFSNCESLEKVIVLGEDTVIESGAFHGCPLKMEVVTSKPLRYDERLHWFGVDFLHVTYKTLPDGHHCSDELFRRYAECRAEGNIRSMWERGN